MHKKYIDRIDSKHMSISFLGLEKPLEMYIKLFIIIPGMYTTGVQYKAGDTAFKVGFPFQFLTHQQDSHNTCFNKIKVIFIISS